MLIQEAMRRATAHARTVKEEHVRRVKGKVGRTDIMTFIEFYRGDDVVAVLWHQPDRDTMLDAVWLGAAGFSADVVAVTMETFHTTLSENPVTGRTWGSGEMAEVAAEHDGLAKGWVVETLVTEVANRAGDSRQVLQGYVIAGRTVEWVDEQDSEEMGAEVGGVVPETILAAMNNASLAQEIARLEITPDRLGLSGERMQTHADIATVKVLEAKLGHAYPMVMLWAPPGSVRAQIIRERFPRSRTFN